jgi:16S rRNA (adenine1518-N6/adenine1519-N6)-dimethyltransferase
VSKVKPKKHLGQHFLKNIEIAKTIANSLTQHGSYSTVLEIGPGMGVLTQFLIKNTTFKTWVAEIDKESIHYLKNHFPEITNRIIEGDFLKMSLNLYFKNTPIAIIGNFPYNISSQILFKVYENKNQVTEVVGMFQKEVAQRIASKPGNKEYGILSVLMQAYYHIEYLFTVNENEFYPPPKVKSGVLRLCRNQTHTLPCNEILFKKVVKTAFNQRRKTLRNSLKTLLPQEIASLPIFNKRPEQLSVEEFVSITKMIS